MNDHDLARRAIRSAGELLIDVSKLPDLLSAVAEDMNGQPSAQNFDSDRTTGHTTVTDDDGMTMPAVSDPTGEAATSPDKARHDRRAIERWARGLDRSHGTFSDLEGRYLRPASPTDRAASSEAGEPGCQSCARIARSDGAPHWSPPHVEASTVKGNLAEPHRLCRWCYDFVLSEGQVPNRKQIQQRLQGGRVRRS